MSNLSRIYDRYNAEHDVPSDGVRVPWYAYDLAQAVRELQHAVEELQAAEWTEEKEDDAPNWWDTLDDAAELLAGLHPDEVERGLTHFFLQLEAKSTLIADGDKEYGQHVIDTAYLVLKKQREGHEWPQ